LCSHRDVLKKAIILVAVKKFNAHRESLLSLSMFEIRLFSIIIIISLSILWPLFSYATAISGSVIVNGKAVHTTAAKSINNKLTIATIMKASPLARSYSKALSSSTRSLTSIVKAIKGTNNNNSTLTKDPSFVMDTNAHSHLKSNNINIAFIKPSFTAAAYDHSFYDFYTIYKDTPAKHNVTTNLNLLTSKVTTQTTDSSSSAFAMSYLSKNIQSLIPKSNIFFLTDADVDAGNIFTKNKDKFDILILGHQEYVTQKEYDNLKQFVASGGTMVLLDGNIFYAEVKYDRSTHNLTLVKGHAWAFNGRSAWKSIDERWKTETAQWIGSNYLCYSCGILFDNDPFEYKQHEEQYITNPKDIILFNYGASIPTHNNKYNLVSTSFPSHLSPTIKGIRGMDTKRIIATYQLNYQKGKVIALGIYADDVVTNSKFIKYFDSLLLKYAISN
jgi:hypothetical protein